MLNPPIPQKLITDLLFLDAEGVDELIIKSIDYENNFPIIICAETISYSKGNNGVKNKELITFLESKGYFMYADTYINSIFVKKDIWIKG